ncbi:MAG TPA: GGDEF domain-containing protein [Dermatophilaceae bacterium]|nr:GGDEF domain-containing protein [Dermatophilaceae bacterium]
MGLPLLDPDHAGARLRALARLTCVAVAAAGVVLFAAWPLGWDRLRSVNPGWVPVKPVTALTLAVLAVAIGLLARDRRRRPRQWAEPVSTGLALAVALTGLVSAFEHLLGVPVGFERLLDPGEASGPRMAAGTAVSLLLAGVGVALLVRRPRGAQVLLVAAAVPPYVAVIGYAARSEDFYRVGSSFGMAAETAVCLVVLMLAALAVAPDGTLSRVNAGRDGSALVLRVAIPATVGLPPVVAAVVTVLADEGLLADQARLAVTVAVVVATNFALVLHLAARLRVIERDRDASWALAERDPGTGIANRRALERAVRDWRRQPASAAAVLAVDLDHFKEVNDGWGHPAGDRVLEAFARALRDAMREGDVVARLGGDEFVVFLPGAAADLAWSAGKRVVAVAASVAGAFPEARRLGASVGLALVGGDEPLGEVLARADAALYRAKADGGRRVVMWSTPNPAPAGADPPGIAAR